MEKQGDFAANERKRSVVSEATIRNAKIARRLVKSRADGGHDGRPHGADNCWHYLAHFQSSRG
jgi:hypothetical protein